MSHVFIWINNEKSGLLFKYENLPIYQAYGDVLIYWCIYQLIGEMKK